MRNVFLLSRPEGVTGLVRILSPRHGKPIRALVVFFNGSHNATLSYQFGWPLAFSRHPKFKTTFLNTAESKSFIQTKAMWRTWELRFDVIILLHSIYSNRCNLTDFIFDAVKESHVPKVFFIGNEHKLMPQKMEFAKTLDIAMLVSQYNDPDIHKIYRARLGCEVAGVTSAAVDIETFNSDKKTRERDIDLGYRAHEAPLYCGYRERSEIAEVFMENQPDHLKFDISLRPEDRYPRRDWSRFLGNCKAQLGCEAGSEFFELDDAIRLRVNDCVNKIEAAEPDRRVDVDDVRHIFPDPEESQSGRLISPRISEAAASRSAQILYSGSYSGYFEPELHYIELKKDHSNLPDVLDRLGDTDFLQEIADRAYERVRESLTFSTLLGKIHDDISKTIL